MNIPNILELMGNIQKDILKYLDEDSNTEENFQNLSNQFTDQKICDDANKLKLLFRLILKIANNHHRNTNFFSKIERILQQFKDYIKKYLSNSELFSIFKSNKRLLLFLLENNLMVIDEEIAKIIITPKYIDLHYPQYFSPEIHPFLNEKWFPKCTVDLKFNLKFNSWVESIKKELPEEFYVKRKIGENDDYICTLIQKDLIEQFIIYVKKNEYPLNSKIRPSIYETNNFLLQNKKITLIEYALFHGSIQIFNFLRKNGVELKKSLWLYAIHGNDAEIISILEENLILSSKKKKDDKKEEEEEEQYRLIVAFSESENEENEEDVELKQLFKESIKCHHINITNYIEDKYLNNCSNDLLINSIKYYNFVVIIYNYIDDIQTLFYYFCRYDYYLLVDHFLKTVDIDINKETIYIEVLHQIYNYKISIAF